MFSFLGQELKVFVEQACDFFLVKDKLILQLRKLVTLSQHYFDLQKPEINVSVNLLNSLFPISHSLYFKNP